MEDGYLVDIRWIRERGTAENQVLDRNSSLRKTAEVWNR